MHYHDYRPSDLVNGPGVSATLFLSGCTHGCKGCYNTSTWSPTSGRPFTQELEDQIIADLSSTEINRRGLSLSGGDPLHENNLKGVSKLIDRVRRECPDKTIWMWTGYKMEDLEGLRQAIALSVDVVVDGKFKQELHDPSLQYMGSSNQRIIKIKD